MFTERKITAFQNRISDLPDTPMLTATELKARFDACPEELRQALNGVCDDSKVLEDRIDAYRAQTFTGEITREMLSSAVQTELDGKASQAALDAAETDNIAAHTEFQSQIMSKCEVVIGSFTPANAEEEDVITLGFQPRMVILCPRCPWVDDIKAYFGIAMPGLPSWLCVITDTGFRITPHVYKTNL
ncbi:MAG: hypothetical protein Q3Y08_05150, partial [Butyricicoccus sp.]|nr:hypothetical protein [Butyricicoccus sp.]